MAVILLLQVDITPHLTEHAICIAFCAEAAGECELHLTHRGAHVGGSPFRLHVMPAKTCASRTQAWTRQMCMHGTSLIRSMHGRYAFTRSHDYGACRHSACHTNIHHMNTLAGASSN